MKKSIVIILFACLTLTGYSQGLFKTVKPFPSGAEKARILKAGESLAMRKVEVRFDATFLVAEMNQNKVTKEWVQTSFSAIGPGISVQSYVPKSDIDPTPVNNYGASLGIALGKTIYDPQFAEAKLVLGFNIWQYFRFGATYTFNPPTDIAKGGFFFGGGITF